MSSAFAVPPFPSDVYESARWTATRQRVRLLEGLWGQDIQARVLGYFGEVRAAIIGRAVRSMNLFDRLCSALASCYDETPRLWHGSSDELPGFLGLDGLVARTGHWELMRDVQRHIVGCREGLIRVDWNRRDGLHVRRVRADAVLAWAWSATPDVPHTVHELRWIDDRQDWFWEVLSLADPSRPVYELRGVATTGNQGGPMSHLGPDYTRQLLGSDMSGSAYPYRWTQAPRRGEPFVPLGLYHAQRTGALWSPQAQQEAVEATLDLAAAWTFWMHALFRASWPQRALFNGRVVSGTRATPTGNGAQALTTEVVTDPTSLLEVVGSDPQHPASGFQWGAGASVLEMADAIGRFESAVSNFDGLDAGHVIRRTSNDAESAASLAIQNESRRAAKRVYEGQQSRVDLEIVDRMAAISNLGGLTPRPLPENGYRVRYVALPLAPSELQARREHNTALIAQGRMSVIDALMDENPGIDRAEAVALKARIDAENAAYKTPVAAPAAAQP